MSDEQRHEPARQPNDLARFFVERANAGDVEGLVALYESGAVLAFAAGRIAVGADQIRQAYQELLDGRPRFEPGEQQAA
jgi:ketosteroid isomerase-like protein